MTTDVAEALPRGSSEFVESSVLEAVVPASSDVDIKNDIKSWAGATDEGGSILPLLSQRNVLLLGMFSATIIHSHVSYSCVGF